MKTKTYITSIALCGALCSPAVFANTPLEVVADITPFTLSSADQQLNNDAIERLRADDKIRGDIAVTTQRGQISLRGTVEEVAMIYRSVEILRDMEGVKQIDVSLLNN
jgi:osmotically-inducible protein OsmY